MAQSYKDISRRKRAKREALIPAEWRLSDLPSPSTRNVMDIPRTCGILSDAEIQITEDYDATALAKAIADKKLKCIDVTRAFCKRAAIAQQLTNCLTEIFFDDALRRAENLDHYIAVHGKTLGPLHGVPISIKDCLNYPGLDSSIGMVALAFHPSTRMSPLISLLLSAGAVFYCKTNVPQTMMALDSDNNVFGRVMNPINNLVTAGGSSGGEGALLAMKGSVLGIGTDIGGSIRIPAMCNGLYGFKPSANRVPFAGQRVAGAPELGKLAFEASAGPLSRSLRDCELFLRTVAAARPWLKDPSVIPGLWDSTDLATPHATPWIMPLTIGVMHSDGLIDPLPPIKNLLHEMSSAMRKGGIRVVDLTPPPSFKHFQSLSNALLGIDGSNAMMDKLDAAGEPLIKWLAPSMKRKKPKTIEQARDMQVQRVAAMEQTLGLWRQPDGKGGLLDIDAIVCPVAPHPVPPIDSYGGVSYTINWVLLDCPAGTIPVRNFTEADMEREVDQGEPLNSWDKKNRALWEIDRSVYVGTPLSIQVVAPRLQEKRLYRAMDGIDRILHARERDSDARAVKL